jgi:hypothetical protein
LFGAYYHFIAMSPDRVSEVPDNTVPHLIVKSALKRYRRSPAVKDFKEFLGRGHSLTINSGWREIAESCLDWLDSQHLKSTIERRSLIESES